MSRSDLPRGLIFTALRGSSARRRRTLLAIIATAVAGLALIWPVYPLVPSIEPYVLGLPFSLAWVIGWMGVVFGALVLLYRAEGHGPDRQKEEFPSIGN